MSRDLPVKKLDDLFETLERFAVDPRASIHISGRFTVQRQRDGKLALGLQASANEISSQLAHVAGDAGHVRTWEMLSSNEIAFEVDRPGVVDG